VSLREGWTDNTLGELCDVRDGTHNSPKQSQVGYPLVTSKNIRDGKVNLSDVYLISDSDFHEINKRSKVDQFDLLISMIGTVGEVCFEPSQPSYAIKNVGLIKTGSELLGRFLLAYLSSRMGKEQIELSTSGSTQKFIGLGKLRSLKVLLPPLEELRRIVDLVSSVDTYIDSLQQQVDSARAARNAVLHELLSAGGDDWTETTLGEIGASGFFSDGDWVESKDQDPEGDFRLLQLADIGDGVFLDKSSRWLNEEQFQRLRCTALVPGDILIARMPDPIARACLFPDGLPVSATVVDVAILRCGPSHFSEFLVMLINDVSFRAAADSLITGTTRQRISRSNLSTLYFSLPPLYEQKRIVEIVSSMDDMIQSSGQAVVEAKNLRSGLLSDLLSGEHEIPKSYDKLLGDK
jgi:restriction endonuclease S subunit